MPARSGGRRASALKTGSVPNGLRGDNCGTILVPLREARRTGPHGRTPGHGATVRRAGRRNGGAGQPGATFPNRPIVPSCPSERALGISGRVFGPRASERDSADRAK